VEADKPVTRRTHRQRPLAPYHGWRWTPLTALACLSVLLLITACTSRQSGRTTAHYSRSGRYYPPPGPPEDPWGPYIRQASARFRVPGTWIREVMRQESAGRPNATSHAGAMGLMQVMPDTYSELQARHGLGDDPYEPRNNILAGTAYLREMYDRFGAPGFLAAYNAGPRRLDDYLSSRQDLPDETVNYVATIAPRLGSSASMSGPLAVYADNAAAYVAPAVTTGTSGAWGAGAWGAGAWGDCDPDAAYDPTRTCAPGRRMAATTPVSGTPVSGTPVSGTPVSGTMVSGTMVSAGTMASGTMVSGGPAVAVVGTASVCDPDAAYDPSTPCIPAPAGNLIRQEALAPPSRMVASAPVAPLPRMSAPRPDIQMAAENLSIRGSWAVQVGAFSTSATARLAAERARGVVPAVLQQANVELRPTAPFGSTVLYRARLTGLSASQAAGACAYLAQSRLACIVVPPEEPSS
jgi:D-alanyl-D-alanine carboxypeptidase